jgi:hypothetical protein
MSSTEAGARALLLEMQVRLANGPYAALGLPSHATAADIRAAFLQLTKQFHPARFGRMSPEIQKMSNEVFLALRAAHDSIAKPATKPGIAGGRASSTTVNPASKPATPTRPFGVAITPTTRPGVPSTGRIPATPRPESGPGSFDPPTQPPQRQSQPLPVAKPGATPAPVVSRQHSPSSQPATRPISGNRVPTPAIGVPVRPAPQPASSGKTPPPQLTRSSSPPGAIRFPATPGRPANPTPGTQPAPQPGRSSSAGQTLEPQLAPILELMGMGMWDAAQAAIDTLASKNPQNRRYAALAAYSRGRRAQLEGNTRIAQIELQEALTLDPDLDIAKTAVAELYARRK